MRLLPLLLLCAACGSYVGPGVVVPAAPSPDGTIKLTQAPLARPLPASRPELLAEADRMTAREIAGPDLDRALQAVERAFALDSSDGEAAWRGVRALYFKTLLASRAERLELTRLCMTLSSFAMTHSQTAEAAYWTGMCLGARAKVNNREGLELIPRMVRAGRLARRRDPTIHHAGPLRLLGGIYLEAPAWPTSVGDLDRALELLEQASELAPDWAETRVMFAKALIEDGRPGEARVQLRKASELLNLPLNKAWAPLLEPEIRRLRARATDP